MDKLLQDVIRQKGGAMLSSVEWREYAKKFACEVNDVEKAFLAGALDAMVFDVAAIKNPRSLPSYEERKSLIKDILKV